MKNNKYEIDMCNGSIMDKLISFALPLMLSGILQLMFNAVDIVVVGRFSGSQSLAAVGSTTALINVFTNLFIGISLGTNVLAARFYGAGKTKEMDSAHCALSDWNYGNSLTTEQNRIKKIFWGDIPMQNSCKVLTRYIINNGSSNNVDL